MLYCHYFWFVSGLFFMFCLLVGWFFGGVFGGWGGHCILVVLYALFVLVLYFFSCCTLRLATVDYVASQSESGDMSTKKD